MQLGDRRKRPRRRSKITLTKKERGRIADRARQENGLLEKLSNVPVPWFFNQAKNALARRTLKYYRRVFRPYRLTK